MMINIIVLIISQLWILRVLNVFIFIWNEKMQKFLNYILVG